MLQGRWATLYPLRLWRRISIIDIGTGDLEAQLYSNASMDRVWKEFMSGNPLEFLANRPTESAMVDALQTRLMIRCYQRLMKTEVNPQYSANDECPGDNVWSRVKSSFDGVGTRDRQWI
jgi:hypothetical protein